LLAQTYCAGIIASLTNIIEEYSFQEVCFSVIGPLELGVELVTAGELMRLLKVAVFSLLASSLMPLTASSQSSQSLDSEATKTSKSSSAQQPSQLTPPSSGDFLRHLFTQQNTGQGSTAPQLAPAPRFKIKVLPRGKSHPFRQLPDVPPNPDPGIYLRSEARLSNMCGTIVSYNFSMGENPHLESVTTCTPSGIAESRRAQGEKNKPPAARLIQTNLTGQR
jgi:hypothetical protein